MINLNKIKKIASKTTLSVEELLYIEYAEMMGLKIEYLDMKFVHIDTKKIYTIEGFIWKYSKVLLSDSYLNNELYIHLKYDKSQDELEQQKKAQHVSYTNLNNTLTSNISTSSILIPANSVTSVSCYTTTHINDLKNDIDSIKRDYQLNELIEDNNMYKYNKYINLLEFQSQYTLNGELIQISNNSPKFKIIIEN